MKPIKFAESNKVLLPFKEGHKKLPVYAADHDVISCWKMSWRERLAALVFGKTWLYVYTISGTQPPEGLKVKRTAFLRKKRKKQ